MLSRHTASNRYRFPEAEAVANLVEPTCRFGTVTESQISNHGVAWGLHPYALAWTNFDQRDVLIRRGDIGYWSSLSAIINHDETGVQLFNPDEPHIPMIVPGVFPGHSMTTDVLVNANGAVLSTGNDTGGTFSDHFDRWERASYRHALSEPLIMRAIRRSLLFTTAQDAVSESNRRLAAIAEAFQGPLSQLDLRLEDRRHEMVAEWLPNLATGGQARAEDLAPPAFTASARNPELDDQVHFALYEWRWFNAVQRLAEAAIVAADCGNRSLARNMAAFVYEGMTTLQQSTSMTLVPPSQSALMTARSELAAISGSLEYGVFDFGDQTHARYEQLVAPQQPSDMRRAVNR